MADVVELARILGRATLALESNVRTEAKMKNGSTRLPFSICDRSGSRYR